jgi:hypothetical protein
MLGQLASHLGYKKAEFEKTVRTILGQIPDPETGVVRYESMSEVDTDERVMERIYELAEFASRECNYKFPPILDVNGTPGLEINNAALE